MPIDFRDFKKKTLKKGDDSGEDSEGLSEGN